LRACGPEIRTPPARANEVLVPMSVSPIHTTALPQHPSRLPSARAAIAASIVLLCSVSLAACGGGSNVSDAVPKSTPDITPPTDTSAEKAAVQTTSTSTTSTAKSSEGTSTAAGEESSGEASPSGGSESGPSESNGEAAGGTSAGESSKSSGGASASKESAATPSGGASAPSG
jgi:hypothetical protein